MSDRKLDILFVQPSSRPLYQRLHTSYSAIEPPVWALLLAQSVRAAGYGAAILDCDVLDLSDEEAVEEISIYNPRLVCFAVYGSEPNQGTARMSSAVPLAKKLKETHPEYKIGFAGSHTQALPLEVLGLPFVDFVLLNEGVYALQNLLATDLDASKGHTGKVKGIGSKFFGAYSLHEPEAVVPQHRMDADLPGYAWDLIPDLSSYRSHFWHGFYQHENRAPFAAIYTSLGCPFKCSFCMINNISRVDNTEGVTAADNPIFRHWSPSHTLKQIERLVGRGVTTLRFSDEMFFLKKSHYEPILKGVRDRWGDSLKLWSYARVDTVKPEMLELFRAAGVRWLCLGIESGNRTVRREVSKGSYEEVDVKRVVQEVEAADIDVISNFIFGLTGDTFDTMHDTLKLGLELNTRMWNAYPAMALPGTPLYLEAKKAGTKLPDTYAGYGFLSYDCAPLGTNRVSPEEVIAFRDNAFQEYWSRPEFQDKVAQKFGPAAKENIQNMLKVKLKRKLLGDPTPGVP